MEQEETERKKRKLQFKVMQRAMLVFFLLAFILLLRQRNVVYKQQGTILTPLSEEEFTESLVEKHTDCLYIWQSKDERSGETKAQYEDTFREMKIKYETADLDTAPLPNLSGYEKIVLAITSYDVLGEAAFDLIDWVKAGGSALIAYPPEMSPLFVMLKDRLGIVEIGDDYYETKNLRFRKELMIGGMEKTYKIADSYKSALTVRLSDGCTVYATTNDEAENPLIWRADYGEGKFIVCNLGYAEQAFRGFYAASYSLLGDFCAYPVINGSAFYIDDFPSPVPSGASEYVTRDFGMDIRSFYTNVWWQDIQNLAKKHGIRYTGMVIEEYSDQVAAPFDRNDDLTRYRYFGNQLLDGGGEIGFHGYNHMPLTLDNFDYKGQFDTYKHWESEEDMKLSLIELESFCKGLFPEEKFQVYVPPSNILSEEGRALLKREFPSIKAIASIYFSGEFEYSQEFCVSEDGTVETPRIISGYILNDYMQIAGLSELNLHYVNSHFQHPDDVLDEERGAPLGWKTLFGRLSMYADWLYRAAPDIRNLTGTEMAAAVQRFYHLDVDQSTKEGALVLELANFKDEAWLLVRLNDAVPKTVTGGELTEAADGLYLLKATDRTVRITAEKRDADE